jgi:hypothetical protein
MLYSNFEHGASLRQFYSRTDGCKASVLIIQDELGHVFGAFASEGWKRDPKRSYGTGDCFLYTFHADKKLRVFHSTYKNELYM